MNWDVWSNPLVNRTCLRQAGYPQRYASPNPSPFPSNQVIANRLRSASRPVVPHRCTAASVFLVKSKTSGPQTGPAFFRQCVGVNRLAPHRPRCPSRRSVKHRAGVWRAVRAKAGYLCCLAVVQPWRYRPSNNRNTAQCAGLIGCTNRKTVSNYRPAVAVQFPHKLVCGF